MLRKYINPILVFPFCFYINCQKALLSETTNNIDEKPKDIKEILIQTRSLNKHPQVKKKPPLHPTKQKKLSKIRS